MSASAGEHVASMPKPSRSGSASAQDPIQIQLGRTVRRLRQESGYSQEDFADRVGVHRTYQSLLERGRVAVTIVTIEKLARALDKRISELAFEMEKDAAANR